MGGSCAMADRTAAGTIPTGARSAARRPRTRMTSSPRGRNLATTIAVVLTLVLALAWLRSSDGGILDVPAGLSVGTVPAAVPPKQPGRSPGLGPGDGATGAEGAGARARRGGTVDTTRAERRRQ